MNDRRSMGRRAAPGRKTLSLVSVSILAIALAACQAQDEGGEPKEGKSPFATGNVSVAPQIDGRPAVATPLAAPLPAPRPTQEP